MSLFATLEIGDNHVGIYNKQYKVVRCQYKFARGYNYRKPDTVTRNKSIEITIIAPDKEDLTLYDWYISKSLLSGRIVFDMSGQIHSDGQPKILQFENAHCFSLSESYHIDKPRRRIIRLEITAEESIVDSVSFTNY